MLGKEKCKALKEIRKQIAENNDIEYVVSECKHQGDCKGTCPKCEAELRYLERELEKRVRCGKRVVVAGLSAIAAIGMTGCNNNDAGTMTGDVPDTSYSTEVDGGETDIRTTETTEYELMGEETCEPISTTEVELDGDVSYIEDPLTETENAPTQGTISK